MSRLRRWLAATHGTGFELVRHFLAGFFESGYATGELFIAMSAISAIACYV
jgi:hypothetical protein